MSANAQLREPDAFDPALLMAGVDVFPEPVAVVERGRILYANHAFGKIPGVASNSELRGRALADLLPETTTFIQSPKSAISLDEAQTLVEATVANFQQDRRALQLVSLRATVKTKGCGEPPSGSPNMESAEKLLPEVAHDFGNLLTGILLYSELLVAGLAGDSRLCRHAEAIRRSGNDGIKLVQQLMPSPQEETIGNQSSSLNQVASEMYSPLGRMVGEEIEIENRLSDPLGRVGIDASELKRIILNLAMNARDAMPKGGKIVVSTRNCAFHFAKSGKKAGHLIPSVELSVEDTGTGMDKHTLSQVFRPFFTTKARHKGTGLGLATVRKIVKQADGEVEIQSELGKGTRVTIRLPQVNISEDRN